MNSYYMSFLVQRYVKKPAASYFFYADGGLGKGDDLSR